MLVSRFMGCSSLPDMSKAAAPPCSIQSATEWAVAFGDAATVMSRSQVRTCTVVITAIDGNLGYVVMLLSPGALLLLPIHILTESLRCYRKKSKNK